jgi:enoyl-CoA hydratase/carnithine racemase
MASTTMTMTDGICEIVLDNPGRKNALSYTLLDDLNNNLETARDSQVGAVILTGAGDAFSAGADFSDLTGTIDDIAIDEAIEQAVIQIRELPAPVFAAVEGPCMGGAVDIALACDFLVASEEAIFEIPAARLSLLYNPEAVKRWRARLSGQTLRRILLLGERFTGTEAQQACIVTYLVDKGAAAKRSRELAEEIIKGNPKVIAEAKSLLVALESGETDLTRWEKTRTEVLDSPERQEAVARAKESRDK